MFDPILRCASLLNAAVQKFNFVEDRYTALNAVLPEQGHNEH